MQMQPAAVSPYSNHEKLTQNICFHVFCQKKKLPYQDSFLGLNNIWDESSKKRCFSSSTEEKLRDPRLRINFCFMLQVFLTNGTRTSHLKSTGGCNLSNTFCQNWHRRKLKIAESQNSPGGKEPPKIIWFSFMWSREPG